MWIEATTIGDLIDRAAATYEGDAVVFPEGRLTWAELASRSDRVARSLRGLGVGRGDKVGILMPNALDYAVLLAGIAKLGAIIVPVNGRFRVHELSHVIGHADIRVLITQPGPEGTVDYPALVTEVYPEIADADPHALSLPTAPELKQVVDLDSKQPGFLTREEFERAADTVDLEEIRELQARVRIRDVAMLMYTSGTTALPKGCLLSHEALVRNGITIARTNYFMTSEDCFWDPLPMFHIGGIVPLLSCASAGAKYVHAGHFDATVSLRQIADERATILYPTFETIWLAILDHPDFEKHDLSAVRLIHNVGVPERLKQMQDRMPHAIQVACFGCTEGSSHLTFPRLDDPEELRMTMLGRPIRGLEIKIVEPGTLDERPTGEVGELLFRGYSLFEGYYKDPEQTATAVEPDGWFHTGDLAAVDSEQRLRYAGRLKDMLKVGGENVSALEIEDYLARHPAVQVVQVVAAPDERYVEVPAAYVQLRPGAAATEDELIEFCRGQIASFKIPRYVRFVDDWPMSGTKIQKYVLRDRIAADVEARAPQPA
jgi:fatty-acyl-CoA synthase